MGAKVLDLVMPGAGCAMANQSGSDLSFEGGVALEISVGIEASVNMLHTRLLLSQVLRDADGSLAHEYLEVTDGLEESLSTMESMLQLGVHSERDLDKPTLELEDSSARVARVLGCTFRPDRTNNIKAPTAESLQFLDEGKSERRKKKEQNRRNWRHRR